MSLDLNGLFPSIEKGASVYVAMSGGVDSSVAAVLAKEAGFDVHGIIMQHFAPDGENPDYIMDAKKVAAAIEIPLHVVNLEKAFEYQVINRFITSYKTGKTPNPCCVCNRYIKFGELLDEVKKLGGKYLVTGHYAKWSDGPKLYRGDDEIRDQSYFLFGLTKQQLEMVRFPLSLMDKKQTRDIAKKYELPVADKGDSQDICFVPDGDYASLVKKHFPQAENIGDIEHVDGRILGQHKGIIHYTVGQRRGLGIGGGEVLFVVRIDAENNKVIVGPREELGCREVFIEEVNCLINRQELENMDSLSVKLRSRQPPVGCRVEFQADDTAKITLSEAFFGVAPGQAAVFYDENRVLGGGWIKYGLK